MAHANKCAQFNYTGMLVAVSKTAGVGVTNVIAMEAAPGMWPHNTLLYCMIILIPCRRTFATTY